MVDVQTKTFLIINTVVFLIFSLIILITWIKGSQDNSFNNENADYRFSNLLLAAIIFLIFFYLIMIFNPYHSIFKLRSDEQRREDKKYRYRDSGTEESLVLRNSYKITYLIGLIFLAISIVLYIVAVHLSPVKITFQTASYIILVIVFVLYVIFMILIFSRPITQGDLTKRKLSESLVKAIP